MMKIPCYKNKSLGLLILRLFVGGIFMVHGIQKLTDMTATSGFFTQIGLNSFWAWVVALVETVAGFALIVGLFVQYAGVLLSVIMAVAIFYVKIPAINQMIAQSGQDLSFGIRALATFGQIEIDLALLGATLALMFTGAGRLSLSRWCKCHASGAGCKVCDVMGCEEGVCGKKKCCEGGTCGVQSTEAPKDNSQVI